MMAREQFRQPHGVTMQMPPEAAGDLLGENSPAAAESPVEWLPLPEYQADPRYSYELGLYPYSGAPVLLTPDGERSHEAVWRRTRAYDRSLGVWRFTGFWARYNSGGQRLGFEPIGYRELKS